VSGYSSAAPDSFRLTSVPRAAWSGSEARTREAHALDAVARLSGGVARDFNEFLTVIAGQAERALALIGPDHPAAGALAEVQTAARAAAGVTADLLAISRRQVLVPEPIDLNTLVRNLVRTLPSTLPAGVHVRFDLAPATLSVDLDPTQITRAITHLVGYMSDGMTNGGGITFATRVTEIGRVRTVRMTVADSGPGVGEDVRERMFEPFVAATSRRRGLALTAAHGIVTQMGGALSVESAPRGGTVFTMAWPASHGMMGRPATPVIAHSHAAGTPTPIR
jgi:signal transduction histidine kinase